MNLRSDTAAFQRSIQLDLALEFVRERRAQLSSAIGREEAKAHPDMVAVEVFREEMLELPNLLDLGELDDAALELEIQRLKEIAHAGR